MYLRVYIFVVIKEEEQRDMFDFALLGKGNCLRRSSFCKGDGCNSNSYTMHFAHWNNSVFLSINSEFTSLYCLEIYLVLSLYPRCNF